MRKKTLFLISILAGVFLIGSLISQRVFAEVAPGCSSDATYAKCDQENPSKDTCTRGGNCGSKLDNACCAGGGGGCDANNWGACSVSCGPGSQTNACGDTRGCNNGACCDPNNWGGWSACSASCGGGTQTRTNACGTSQSQACNAQACPTAGPTNTPVPTQIPLIKDYSGYNNHGQDYGTSVVEGKVGQARGFDGSSKYAAVPDSSTLKTPKFTLAFWLRKTSEPKDFDNIIAKSKDNKQGFIVLYNQTAPRGVYLAIFNTDGAETHTASKLIGLTLNTWEHIAFSFDGKNVEVYKNGESLGKIPFVGATYSPSTDSLTFARSSRGEDGFLAGELDEVRYYNRALNANEVKEVYNLAQ